MRRHFALAASLTLVVVVLLLLVSRFRWSFD